MRAAVRLVPFLAVLTVALAHDSSQAGPPATAIPSQYIVVLDDSADAPSQATDAARSQNVSVENVYSHAINGYSFRGSAAAAARIARLPHVRYVVPDRVVSAVGSVPLSPGETAPAGVQRIGAATTTTAREASSVNVAVIDTGIDLTHPDLNAVDGRNCIGPGAARDDNGHGTHVSGTIAAKNLGAGVVGVAPGTKLYAVKVLDAGGSGSWSSVICGIDWVTANTVGLNIKVASMSLGGSGSNDGNCGLTNADPLHTAICRSTAAGVTYVVAAGNSALDFGDFTPAAYPEVLTVTAMSDSDGRPGGLGGAPACRFGERDDYYASFSNFATRSAEINHTIAGPGVCVRSTWLGGTYNTISGTSMATPHVTGAVALCLGEVSAPGPCAGLTPASIIAKLRADAAAHATPLASGNGFVGDPNRRVTIVGDNDAVYTPYFGYLVWAGGSVPATPGFSLSVTPASRSVVQGAGASYAVAVTRTGGFAGAVVFSLTGLGAGATGTFTPGSATGDSATLAITTTTAATPGTFPLTITGTSGTLARTATAALIVTALPTPDFSLSITPASSSVLPGGGTSYAVTVTRTGGFADAVSFVVSGSGAGATGTFTPGSTTGNSATLAITTTTAAATGSFALTITGTGGALTRTANATLVVTAPPTPGFSLSVSPASRTVVQGTTATYTVAVTPAGGFSGNVTLSATGLPAGASASFSPNPSGTSSTLTVTTPITTLVRSYSLTITGVSGTITRTTTATLVVTAAARCIGGDGEC